MNQLLDRYEREGADDEMDEDFWDEYHRAEETYNSASIIVDALNAQEAVKVEAEAREQLMKDREALEILREEELSDKVREIEDNVDEVASKNAEIAYLQTLNADANISEADLAANLEEISGYRAEIFEKNTAKTALDAELAEIAARHGEERATEADDDKKYYDKLEEDLEFNRQFDEAVEEFQELTARK